MRGAVRDEVLGLGVQLERRDLLQRVLLLVLHAHALVHQRELTSPDLLPDLVPVLHRVPLVELQQLHPLHQQLLVSEVELLLAIDPVPMADLDPEPGPLVVDALDGQPLQADHDHGVLQTVGLTDSQNGVLQEQLDLVQVLLVLVVGLGFRDLLALDGQVHRLAGV